MSRTDSTSRIKSPVKHYITFGGGDGIWSYWDKESESDVEFDTLELVLVEIRSSITGWSDEHNGRITSNLVSNTKETLTLRCKNKEILKGSYADCKPAINEAGGKFTTNLFGLFKLNGELVAAQVQLTGSSLAAWMNFVDEHKLHKIYAHKIVASKGDQLRKGAVKYYQPVFTLVSADKTDLEAADKFSIEELKPYLEQ
jgi:hypothetical protein